MFLEDSAAGSGPTLKGLGDILTELKSAATDALSPNRIGVRFAEIEDLSRRTTKTISGMFGSVADALQDAAVQSYRNTIEIGASFQDQLDIMQEIASQQRVGLMLSTETTQKAIEFSKATGIAAKDIGTIVLGFADLGIGTEQALESMSNMSKEARSYGLNVGQFMSTVASNIKLVNAYGFKDGVKGLTSMAAKAQQLRIELATTTQVAAKLLSPESAIETAAAFQMLGGNIGELGDPFKLLYMAQNDMEGLQDAIVDAAKSSVMFNRETGEFKISATEMYRLRAQADALGISYEELANTAVKAAKQQEVLSQIKFSGLNEEQEKLVSSLAELKDGKVQIQLPGLKEVLDTPEEFARLTQEGTAEYAALQEYQNQAAMTDREIAVNQLSTLQAIQNALTGVRDVTVTTPGFQEIGKQAAQGLKDGIVGISNEIKSVASSGDYQTAMNETVSAFNEGFKNILSELKGGNFAGATQAVVDMGVELAESTGIIDQFNKALDTLSDKILNIPSITPTRTDDLMLGPSAGTTVMAPKGTFQLDEKDSLIAGTNLFGGGAEKIQKLEFANAAQVDVRGSIQVNGIPNNAIGQSLLRDPDFVSGIRGLFSSTIKQQLGKA
jgi:hypothetical protein